MSIVNELDLETLELKAGGHAPGSGEMCVMEAVAFVAGESWSDHPACASKVIGAFMRSWNDSLDDTGRQLLKPYVTRLVGTAGDDALEARRAWMATDWLVRVQTPAWLRLAGLTEQAERLAALPELVGGDQVPSIKPALEAARSDAAAAWAAAWDAARDAARAALAPTVEELQISAHQLLDNMIEVSV